MTRRLLRLLASLAVATSGLTVVAGGPAAADQQPVLTIRAGEVTTATYDPIPGNFPAAPTAINWWPNECALEASAFCDAIPLDIVVPDIGPADVFFVTIELTWEDPEGLNDLDMYLWDDRQTSEAQGGTSYTEVNRAASADNPESLKQITPTLGRYNLTILNWSGPNLGYSIKAYVTIAEFDPPFELLAPEFQRPADPAVEESVTPFDYSATPPSDSGGPIAPTFGEIPVQPDTALDFEPSDFDRNLAAPPPIRTGNRLTNRPPRPVPGAVAAFWLGAVPLLLTAGAVLLVMRRRRDTFAFA